MSLRANLVSDESGIKIAIDRLINFIDPKYPPVSCGNCCLSGCICCINVSLQVLAVAAGENLTCGGDSKAENISFKKIRDKLNEMKVMLANSFRMADSGNEEDIAVRYYITNLAQTLSEVLTQPLSPENNTENKIMKILEAAKPSDLLLQTTNPVISTGRKIAGAVIGALVLESLWTAAFIGFTLGSIALLTPLFPLTIVAVFAIGVMLGMYLAEKSAPEYRQWKNKGAFAPESAHSAFYMAVRGGGQRNSFFQEASRDENVTTPPAPQLI